MFSRLALNQSMIIIINCIATAQFLTIQLCWKNSLTLYEDSNKME